MKRGIGLFLPAVMLLARAALAEGLPQPGAVPRGILFQGTAYSAYSGSQKIWEMRAEHISGTRARVKAAPVHAELYRNGKIRYFLFSKTAYINPNTADVFFPDGAVFTSPDGEVVNVRLLFWKAAQKKFFGSKGVRLRHGNTRVRGDRMVLDQNYASVRISGHVKSEYLQ